MYTTKLRRVGGSVMMVVPPAILELMRLKANETVELAVEGERLIVESPKKPRYSLAELLAERGSHAPVTDEDRAWLESPPAGRELL